MARNPRPVVPDVNVHLLPPQLRLLVRVLGEAAAFKLVEQRGGGYVVVPKRPHPDHWLAELIGPIPFAALVEHYGDQTLQLPKYDSVLRQVRHERVRQLRREGRTLSQVAVQTNYTMRQVINILAADEEAAEAARQADLFGGGEDAQPDEPEPAAHDPFGLSRRTGSQTVQTPFKTGD